MRTVYEANANWIHDYIRIQRTEKTNPEQIHRSLQNGLHIKHPENTMGYAGFFSDLGDVFVSGSVAGFMNVKAFRIFVMESLKRFDKGDFGQISRSDADENIENRYMFGIDRLFGRYGFHNPACKTTDKDAFDDVICIRKHNRNTWITFDSEADWFLFLDEEDMKKIKSQNWKQE